MHRKNQYANLLLLFLGGYALPAWASDDKTFHEGDMLVHVRLAHINPAESAEVSPIGGTLHVNVVNMPSVDVSYFLDDEIALQFLPGLVQHESKLTGTRMGDKNLENVWAIAPTLFLQYHYEITDRIKPYVGIGMSYVTYIEDDDVDIEYDSAFAGVIQAGIDVAVDDEKRWWANIDAKKAWAGTKSVSSQGRVTGDITLNPLILGAGIGYKF